jgi:hypothetical protein
MQVAMTPYEEFLRQSIDEQKTERDKLYNEFAKANPLRKQLLKRKIEETNQNLALLSADAEKYKEGLDWLREPSKERDEKAEHLPKLAKEEAAAAPTKPAAVPGKATVVARPTIGKPIGSPSTPTTPQPTAVAAPRPTIGTPVGRPQIGTPVGTPKPSTTPQTTQPSGTSPPRPVIGTPVGGVKRPVIGTPIGTPKTETPPPTKPAEKKPEVQNDAGETTTDKSDAS